MFLVIFCLVSSSHLYVAQKVDAWLPNEQEDDRWIWGYVNKAEAPDKPVKIIQTTSTDAPQEENPCLRTDPIMPDFNAPGRRISEIKCYEYIWNIKLRQHTYKKEQDCKEYRKKQQEFFITVLGGRNALPGEFPHMGAIGWKAAQGTWVFKCGGSLISSKFILTAGHCTRASSLDTTIADPVPKIVRLGDKNIIDEFANGVFPLDANIIRIIPHPQYKSPKRYFDIALMELENEVKFTYTVQPACLWTRFDTSPLGVSATVTGWGVVQTATRTTSPTLQAAEVDIIDNDQCDQLLKPLRDRHWSGINETQICGGNLAGGVDACQGDSGGPLQVKIPLPPSGEGAMHHVIGVTSFGFGCALADRPGVYTRVSSFIDWIESIVWR